MWINLEHYYQFIWFNHKNAVFLCMCTGCERCQNSQSPEWAFLSLQQFVGPAIVDCTRSRCIVLRQNQFLASWWQVFTYLNSTIVHNNFENIMIFIVSPYAIVIKTFYFTLECRSLKIYDLNYWIKDDSSHKFKNHVSKVPNSSMHNNLYTTPLKRNCPWLFTCDRWKKYIEELKSFFCYNIHFKLLHANTKGTSCQLG